MEINDFIEKFIEIFEDEEIPTLTPETNFHNLDAWSSLIALSLIAMVDDEYDVDLKGDDIRNADTIESLYKIVKSRI